MGKSQASRKTMRAVDEKLVVNKCWPILGEYWSICLVWFDSYKHFELQHI